jgi:hypothetical protein
LFGTAREGNVQSFFDFYHTYLHFLTGRNRAWFIGCSPRVASGTSTA